MSRFIPPHPKKGSAEAKAWGAWMQAARQKKVSIRGAGLRTEKQFFGPSGVFAKAGHRAHLMHSKKRPTEKMNLEALSRLTGKSVAEVMALLKAGGSVFSSQRGNGPSENPGQAWHEGMEHVAARYSRLAKEPLEKVLFKGIEVAHRDSATAARRLHMNRRPVRRTRKNPLAVFSVGNPPKRISTGIAGVVYSRCLEIRAEKTKFKPGLYRHPFARSSGVQILALDNGDLLVHSTRGVNLWEPMA